MNENTNSKLLTPGPVTVHPAVAEALATQSPLHHRSRAFSSLLCAIEAAFRRIFHVDERYHVLMLGTSGSGANEAMLGCLSGQKRGTVLVLTNGHFGERLADMCASIAMPFRTLCFAPAQGIDLREVETSLRLHDDIGAVLLAHHETSLGLVNPVEGLARLCKRYDRLLCADMVSSVGGEEFFFDDESSPDIAVTVSGKALGAFPGVAFLIVKKCTAGSLLQNKHQRGYYFDLGRALKSWNDSCEMPFTPPTVLFPPLLAALREIEREGLTAKIKRHSECLAILSGLLENWGFSRVSVRKASKTTATYCHEPNAATEFELLKRGIANQGFILYENKRYHVPQRLFQVSTMGFLAPGELHALAARLARPQRFA